MPAEIWNKVKNHPCYSEEAHHHYARMHVAVAPGQIKHIGFVPRDLAREITQKLSIPTIGIGAGPDCDGQVLVLHDVLGLSDTPLKFTKHYADLRNMAIRATEQYIHEVRDGSWPDDQHSFH